jgi:transcriptional regulator with XRE-family HTH domain
MVKLVKRSIGELIREARHEAQLSADGLAYQLGVTANTVYRWERNDHEVTMAKLRLIGVATGKPLAYFLDGERAA